MANLQLRYEELLAEYSDHRGAIALLKQYRPYLETVPSMRRPDDSVITIPLPVVRVRQAGVSAESGGATVSAGEVLRLPCDVAILMCDPEWQVKTGPEIFVFIYRPNEDFSELLSRWRRTQVLLDKGYEWLMPPRHKHILSEAAEETHPLFVVFQDTPERIRRGLRGAGLPFVVQAIADWTEDEDEPLASERSSSEVLETEE
jgi:hypothetical protein